MSNTELWQRDGYIVCPGVFEPALIEELREGCDASLDQWQRHSIAEGEPGAYCYGPTAWVMLHLNHPKYHRQHPERLATLLNAVADPRVMSILDDIFRGQAVFMQINHYVDPAETRPTTWHRDCQFYPETTEENEQQVIDHEGDPPREIHMHIPLVPTAATEVVPGSQLRTDTRDEARIRREEPDSDEMPEALRLRLEPGDLAFFHVNALHRGLYSQGVRRRTIAVTLSRADATRPTTAEMMEQRTGYVASYQPWFLKPGYLDGCSAGAVEFYQRFIDIYRDSWRPEYLETLHPSLQEYFTEC